MKKSPAKPDTFGISPDKLTAADPQQIARSREIVREKVVKPIADRAARQKEAVARARLRYVR